MGQHRNNFRLLVFVSEFDYIVLLHIWESEIRNLLRLLVLIWWFLSIVKVLISFFDVDSEVWWHSFIQQFTFSSFMPLPQILYCSSLSLCHTDNCFVGSCINFVLPVLNTRLVSTDHSAVEVIFFWVLLNKYL